MGNYNALAAKIRNRFQDTKNAAYLDYERTPLPWQSLNRQEFSIAVAQKWVEKKSKGYFLTREFMELAASLPLAARPDDDEPAPEAEGVARDTQTEGRRAPYQRDSRYQRLDAGSESAIEEPSSRSKKVLATEPKGKFQIKVLEIVYRGTSKLGQPLLLVMGCDEAQNIKKVQRGFSREIADQMCNTPQKFYGKVLSVDEKGNFVGFVLGQPIGLPADVKKEEPNPSKDSNDGPSQMLARDIADVGEAAGNSPKHDSSAAIEDFGIPNEPEPTPEDLAEGMDLFRG